MVVQFSQKFSGTVVSWLPLRSLRAHPHGVSGALDSRGEQRDGAGSQAAQAGAAHAEAFAKSGQLVVTELPAPIRTASAELRSKLRQESGTAWAHK